MDTQPDSAPSRDEEPPARSRAEITVTKRELVLRIAERCGETKTAIKVIVELLLDEMTSDLAAGKRIEFRDFGVFEVRARNARLGRNPLTREEVAIPPTRTVKFKPGGVLRERMGAKRRWRRKKKTAD